MKLWIPVIQEAIRGLLRRREPRAELLEAEVRQLEEKLVDYRERIKNLESTKQRLSLLLENAQTERDYLRNRLTDPVPGPPPEMI